MAHAVDAPPPTPIETVTEVLQSIEIISLDDCCVPRLRLKRLSDSAHVYRSRGTSSCTEVFVMLFLQALFALLLYDILSTFRPFKVIRSTVKGWKVADKQGSCDIINRVSRAVDCACLWYPKQALCLQRSFVSTYLLRKRGIPAQMVLGALKLPFKAHAWVEVNERAVNERSDDRAIKGVWERC